MNEITTHAIQRTAPLTYTHLINTVNNLQERFGKPVKLFKCNQDTFNKLYDYIFETYRTNNMEVEIDKTKDRPLDPHTTIYGARIIIDNDMLDGHWKFES